MFLSTFFLFFIKLFLEYDSIGLLTFLKSLIFSFLSPYFSAFFREKKIHSFKSVELHISLFTMNNKTISKNTLLREPLQWSQPSIETLTQGRKCENRKVILIQNLKKEKKKNYSSANFKKAFKCPIWRIFL